jgi:ABC-2 type transport system permease protein
MKSNKRLQSLIRVGLILAIIVVINVLGSFVYSKLDLTEDGRFTMTAATNNLLKGLNKDSSSFAIEIYLEGDFPSEFQHLKNAVHDLLSIFRERSDGMIDFVFRNPLEGTDEERQARQQVLGKEGIVPLQINDPRQARAMLVFPFAKIRLGNRFRIVSLIELGDGYYQPSDITASINFLEYKFASAIQKLMQQSRPRMVLLTGHGELQRPYTNEFEKALFEFYDIARLNLSQVNQIDTNINLVVVPKPLGPFSYDDQFKIDQYLMHGGRMLWLIDALNMEDDSLRTKKFHLPFEYPHDLQKMLFNYGIRVNNNIVSSFDAASFPGAVNGQGQKANPKWYYYPLAFPYHTPLEAQQTGRSAIDHPIVKNLDFVQLKYAGTIDTVKTKADIKKTVLLRTSKYSKVQFPPTRISSDILNDPAIHADAFTKGNQDVAILLEGPFDSYFRNRIPPETAQRWKEIGNYPILAQGNKTRMIVVSDGDIAKNDVHQSGKLFPLGAGIHPEFGPRMFSNREFLMNCVEYLLDDSGLISARSREIKLRPLDQERAFQEETKWQIINLGLPLLLLGIFGFTYAWLRRRRYGR